MDNLVLRPAEPRDAPAVHDIREAYYAARNSPVQLRNDVEWWVVEQDDDVLAVQAYQDATSTQRTITDTYCRDSNRGRLALAYLVHQCHKRADAEGVTLVGMTEPDNVQNQKAMEKRGYKLAAYLYVREPG